ncbi:L-histidine N(alpha)-methyltransferase [Oxalobacteraceae sp. CFBP 13708]|nr:L-histidine N(alpha)-methyltransferase [Oxalobacteraceae sp. CFBP 8753]MBD8722547.1 L-histidine N(alpha)-methyltransferase [Oxalobacteraceae sp. CFBP 13708]
METPMDKNPVIAYYDSIAAHYDNAAAEVADEQLEDLDEAREQISTLLAGHRILELGCGSGAWTEVLAETAESIVATDASAAMLELAQMHGEDLDNVEYRLMDALALPADLGTGDDKFTAVFLGGLWAHLTRKQQDDLLQSLKKRLGKDVLLVLFDDNYVEGESAVTVRTDLLGNTHEFQLDADGKQHELVKNYPTDSALRKRVGVAGREIRVARWEFYWVLTCRLK